MTGFLLDERHRNECWEVCIFMPSLLETAVKVLLEELPQSIAIWPNDHCSTDRSIAGQLSFPDNIYIPPVNTHRVDDSEAWFELSAAAN